MPMHQAHLVLGFGQLVFIALQRRWDAKPEQAVDGTHGHLVEVGRQPQFSSVWLFVRLSAPACPT
jgi:hypothetical protein